MFRLRAHALRSLVSALLIAALLDSGCSRAPQRPATGVVPASLERISLDDALGAFADAGVAVYDSAKLGSASRTVHGVPSALRLLRINVEMMAGGFNAGAGVTGAALDELAPVPRNGIPLSYFLAAWVSNFASPAARFARRRMGKHDWHDAPAIAFPTLIIALFVADAVRQNRIPARASAGGLPFATVPMLTAARAAQQLTFDLVSICEITQFEDHILEEIFDAIRIKDSGGLFGFFAQLVNAAASFIHKAVKDILAVAQAPLLGALQHSIAILSLVSFATSNWQPWAIANNPQPGFIDLTAPPASARFVASADTHGIVFPPAIVKCAQAIDPGAGDLNEAATRNAKVTWTVVQGKEFFAPVSSDSGLSLLRIATFVYAPQSRPAAAGCSARDTSIVRVRVTVDNGIKQILADLISNTLINDLPLELRTFIGANVQAELQKLSNRLADLSVSRDGIAKVQFAIACRPPPSPVPPKSTGNASICE